MVDKSKKAGKKNQNSWKMCFELRKLYSKVRKEGGRKKNDDYFTSKVLNFIGVRLKVQILRVDDAELSSREICM